MRTSSWKEAQERIENNILSDLIYSEEFLKELEQKYPELHKKFMEQLSEIALESAEEEYQDYCDMEYDRMRDDKLESMEIIKLGA